WTGLPGSRPVSETYHNAHRAITAALMENERGEQLRESGHPHDAYVHFQRALAALESLSGPNDRQRSVVLNNLGLTAVEKNDLAEAKRWLIQSLEAEARRRRPDRLGLAITYDNLGKVEVGLARRSGPFDLGKGYVNMTASAHLNEAEAHFAEAEKRF